MSDFIRFKDFEEELAISPYLDLYPGRTESQCRGFSSSKASLSTSIWTILVLNLKIDASLHRHREDVPICVLFKCPLIHDLICALASTPLLTLGDF